MAAAAIASGFLAISGWRDNFVRYGYAWHALQTEKFLYLAKATNAYADKDGEKAARHFAYRIEEIVTAEVTAWRATLENLQ